MLFKYQNHEFSYDKIIEYLFKSVFDSAFLFYVSKFKIIKFDSNYKPSWSTYKYL